MECENTSVKLSGQIFASMLSATTNHVSSVDLNRLGLHQLSPVLDQSHWVVAHHTVKLQLLSSKDVEASQATSKALSNLHLDHTIELQQICDVWKQLTPPRAPVWRKYVDHSKLCNLIFEESNVQFRCARWSREHRMCHDMSRSHFGHLITTDELGPNVVVENKVHHQSVETCRVCCTS